MKRIGLMGIAAHALGTCGSDVTTSGTGGAGTTGSTTTTGAAQGGAAAGGQAGTGGAGGQGASGSTCEPALGDYGDCDLALGWAFDGADCVSMTGCDCAPDCGAFATDFAGCVSACTGYCDASAFVGDGIASGGWAEGSFCDEIYTCVKADVVPMLQALVPASTCEANGCGAGQDRCTLASGGEVTAEDMSQFCAATLIEDLDELRCLVIGP